MAADLNWVDYIILTVIFFSAIAGLGRGFVREIVGLITLIVSIAVATIFCHPLALKFTGSSSVQGVVNQASSATGMDAAEPVSYMATGFSFTLLFIGTYIAGSIIGYFLNMVFQYGILGLGNRLLGLVFGLIRGVVFTVVLIFLVELTPFHTEPAFANSKLVKNLEPASLWLAKVAAPGIEKLKEKVDSSVKEVGGSIQEMTSSYQGFGQ